MPRKKINREKVDINQVIEELEAQRDAIDQALAALRGETGARSKSQGKRRGWKQSPEARRKIALAQTRRWAILQKQAMAKKHED